MTVPPDVRSQLRTLKIAKEQRPVTQTGRHSRGIWVAVLFFGLVLAGVGVYAARDRLRAVVTNQTAAPQVPLVVVSANDEVAAVLTATGKIVSDHIVQVATKVSGQIVDLNFEQGDGVEKGQMLARIEDVLYRARRDEAAARLAKSRANLEYQKINFERVASLIRGESAPPIEYADAQRWLHDAQAQEAADAAALKFAQKALDDTEVAAPIAGVVLTRDVEVGDFVSAEGGRGAMANAQFATIADMGKLRVEVDISELDIARVRRGMACVITPDAYKDRRYRGHVLWIDPGANYSKATVQVKVRIENPDDYLRVEGSAQVEFREKPADPQEAATQRAAIWIPATACLLDADGKKAKVFVVTEGRLQTKPITVGRRRGAQLEVLHGLSKGHQIAADNLDKLFDGQPVGP